MFSLIRNYFARRRIKGLFGSYVSPELVKQMVKAGEKLDGSGRDLCITPFFASVHNYVGLAEGMPSSRLVGLMNEYFTACTSEITGETGTLDKYIGDTIVAMFGAPLPMSDHALRACVATLRCQMRVAELRERWRREGARWPEAAGQFRVRVGLDTDWARVGNVGSATRFNYSMMGDTVNIAARMESGAKDWGVWALCTAATRAACTQSAPRRVVFRTVGRIVVKGRAQPMELSEVVAFSEEATDQLYECIAKYERGLALLWERDWAGAIAQFEKSAVLERYQPGSSPEITRNPSTVSLARAREFQANPSAVGPWELKVEPQRR